MEVAFKSDVGQVRSHNEDNGGFVYNKDSLLLVVVADGMGGHQAGDVASNMTKKLMLEKWQETSNVTTPKQIEEWLNQAITDVNEEIYNQSITNPLCQGMGTTLVAVVCSQHFFTFAHIGDSRVYVLNESSFFQKTEDHSLVNELVRSGQIAALEAENHPRKNVLLRALGTERSIKIDVETINWDEGSYILLCSDGLSNKVKDVEMEEILKQETNINDKISELIEMANNRGGEDNISIAIVYHSISEQHGDMNDR